MIDGQEFARPCEGVSLTLIHGRAARSGRRTTYWKEEAVGIRHIRFATSRNAARALDAVLLRSSIEGCMHSSETKGQCLPSRLESPM
jgi:hypothetical protein